MLCIFVVGLLFPFNIKMIFFYCFLVDSIWLLLSAGGLCMVAAISWWTLDGCCYFRVDFGGRCYALVNFGWLDGSCYFLVDFGWLLLLLGCLPLIPRCLLQFLGAFYSKP